MLFSGTPCTLVKQYSSNDSVQSFMSPRNFLHEQFMCSGRHHRSTTRSPRVMHFKGGSGISGEHREHCSGLELLPRGLPGGSGSTYTHSKPSPFFSHMRARLVPLIVGVNSMVLRPCTTRFALGSMELFGEHPLVRRFVERYEADQKSPETLLQLAALYGMRCLEKVENKSLHGVSFSDLIYMATGTQSPPREKFRETSAGEVRLNRHDGSPHRQRVYHDISPAGMAPSLQKVGTRRYSPPSSPEGSRPNPTVFLFSSPTVFLLEGPTTT